MYKGVQIYLAYALKKPLILFFVSYVGIIVYMHVCVNTYICLYQLLLSIMYNSQK